MDSTPTQFHECNTNGLGTSTSLEQEMQLQKYSKRRKCKNPWMKHQMALLISS